MMRTLLVGVAACAVALRVSSVCMGEVVKADNGTSGKEVMTRIDVHADATLVATGSYTMTDANGLSWQVFYAISFADYDPGTPGDESNVRYTVFNTTPGTSGFDELMSWDSPAGSLDGVFFALSPSGWLGVTYDNHTGFSTSTHPIDTEGDSKTFDIFGYGTTVVLRTAYADSLGMGDFPPFPVLVTTTSTTDVSPFICCMTWTNGTVAFNMGNLVVGTGVAIERAFSFSSGEWQEVDSFDVGQVSVNWAEYISNTWNTVYYRMKMVW